MIQQAIIQEYDGTNIRMLAIKYDYSEETIRSIIKESVKNRNNQFVDGNVYGDINQRKTGYLAMQVLWTKKHTMAVEWYARPWLLQ